MPAEDGSWLLDRKRDQVQSRLNPDLLAELAEASNGRYLEANYRDSDTDRILELAVQRSSAQQASDEQTRVWNERFYLFLIPLMLLLLPRFRRGVFGRGVNP